VDASTLNKRLVLTLLVVLVPSVASASVLAERPRAAVTDDSCESQAKQLTKDSQLARGQGDLLREIELLQQAYDKLSACSLERIYGPLAQAYWDAYSKHGNEEHLQRAKEMFSRHLETLAASDGEARVKTEVELAKVEAEIKRLDDERARVEAKRAQDERNRITQEAARRAVAEAAQRQRREEQAERERQRREEQDRLRAKTERERRHFVRYMSIGGSMGGLGLLLLSPMAIGLRRGELVDREGASLATNPNTPPEQLGSLARQGTRYNQLAWTTGTIGSALIVSGTTVVAVALWRRTANKPQTRAALVPRWQGLEVRF
jgi:hypothetical protein